jgi:hypothetical protein
MPRCSATGKIPSSSQLIPCPESHNVDIPKQCLRHPRLRKAMRFPFPRSAPAEMAPVAAAGKGAASPKTSHDDTHACRRTPVVRGRIVCRRVAVVRVGVWSVVGRVRVIAIPVGPWGIGETKPKSKPRPAITTTESTIPPRKPSAGELTGELATIASSAVAPSTEPSSAVTPTTEPAPDVAPSAETPSTTRTTTGSAPRQGKASCGQR